MEIDSPKPLRSRLQVFLVGPVKIDFLSSRIPTRKEVLQVFFYFFKVDKCSIYESIKRTAEKVMSLNFDNKKRIDHIKVEIKKLHGYWRGSIW